MNLFQKAVPRTLLIRTFFLVSLLLFVSVATWLTLFSFAELEPRAQRLAQLTVSLVNLTRSALVAADPGKRLSLLRDLAEREGLHLYPAEPGDTVTSLPDNLFFQRVYDKVVSKLGPATDIAGEVNAQKGLWVSFSIGDSAEDVYWLMLPEELAENDLPWYWLAWGAVSLTLALIVAWYIVSRISQPLRRLSEAASELGHGRHPAPLPESGDIELQQLASAFNRMSGNLRRNDIERTEILAGISHDLRTPLSRLRLEVEMSIDDRFAREGAIADIEQMDAIVTQFLTYARGESGETIEMTDISELVTRCVKSAERHTGTIRLTLPALPAIPVYRKSLMRALSNLLENAIKYGSSPISMTLKTDSDFVVIDVTDCGPGIPENETEHMKRPFSRMERARTGASGTGLGLAIVDRVARLHQGKFELLPREGGGLIARLSLPLK